MKSITVFIVIATTVLLVAFTQTYNISGVVKDDEGSPVPYVTVSLKGSKTSTTTDLNGNFSITSSATKGTLIFSAVGFTQKEIKFTGSTSAMQVTLKNTANEISDDSVTTAFGIQRSMPSLNYATADKAIKGKISRVYIPNTSDFKSKEFETESGYHDEEDTNFNREGYDKITDNPFVAVNQNPLSTFSIDVDGAAYSNVRRFINEKTLPPAGAVRIEELINYFSYNYEQPKNENPFAVHTELINCPWNNNHHLALIALQGKKMEEENLPPSNLIFLIDVSGSMMDENKLPLVKASLQMLTDKLRPQDKVALVTYAGAAGLVLNATSGNEKEKIKHAINALEAGGSTAGGAGIQLAYNVARNNFMEGGNNRIILCTDGDFNVGESSDDAMERLIEKERNSGIFLSVLGFGMGNYQDAKMQILADKGNGNHAYIDGISEAKKVFVHEFGGTLFTIAKDVKLQVEFNPAIVKGYRLIGYENRMLAKEDFNNDTKDAGELGSGHTVTALYEIIPAGSKESIDSVDGLHYQNYAKTLPSSSFSKEYMFVKLRYKKPDGHQSILLTHTVQNAINEISKSSMNIRFAASVAAFGLALRNSPYKGMAGFDMAYNLAQNAIGTDKEGYRAEYMRLLRDATMLERKTLSDDRGK